MQREIDWFLSYAACRSIIYLETIEQQMGESDVLRDFGGWTIGGAVALITSGGVKNAWTRGSHAEQESLNKEEIIH